MKVVAYTKMKKQKPIKKKELYFHYHLIVFLAINAILFLIDALYTPGYWFYWPLIATAIVLALHGWMVFKK